MATKRDGTPIPTEAEYNNMSPDERQALAAAGVTMLDVVMQADQSGSIVDQAINETVPVYGRDPIVIGSPGFPEGPDIGVGAYNTGRLTGSIPSAAREVFENESPVDDRRAEIKEALMERQARDAAIRQEAQFTADWMALSARTGAGTPARTVVDERKLQMQQSAIDDALNRGMAQLESQFQIMSEELERQRTLASDEIQRSRMAALDSLTQLQSDLQERSAKSQADIARAAARTGGSIEAATQQALRRLGTTSGVVSEGIRRRLAEEGQVERELAGAQSDIQADLAARLGQISQSALDRQRGLAETTAFGSSAELANLVARINAERASERSASEFELSEQARQQALELLLNPPTKKVGGRAKGDLNKYALQLEVMEDLGVPAAAALAAVASGNDAEVIASYADPEYTEEQFQRDAFAQASKEQAETAMENYLEGLIENPTYSMFMTPGAP